MNSSEGFFISAAVDGRGSARSRALAAGTIVLDFGPPRRGAAGGFCPFVIGDIYLATMVTTPNTAKSLAWLEENLSDLLLYGNGAYREFGRGAVVMDVSEMLERSFALARAAGETLYVPESDLPVQDEETRLKVVVVFRAPGSKTKIGSRRV